LKNHLGSINGFYAGSHSMHDYIYLNNGSYDSDSNPIVDINLNTNILDKTALIIGDALYAGWSSNNTPPEKWTSFNNDSPNMLFFGVDPVAIDSVMFDYLDREGYVNPKSEDILIVAANAGLGVHERWNNDTDRKYSVIDYVEIGDSGSEPDDSTEDSESEPDDSTEDSESEPDDSTEDSESEIDGPNDNFQNSSSGGSGGCFILTLQFRGKPTTPTSLPLSW